VSKEHDEDPERFHRDVVAATKAAGGIIVEGHVRGGDKEVFPTVGLPCESAINIIKFAKPRLVYFAQFPFEVENEIAEGDAFDESLEETLSTSPPFEKLKRKWKRRNGEPGLAIASFVVDGVLHTSVSEPSWKLEFDEELLVAEEEVRQLHDNLEASLEAADEQEVEGKASTLAEHPSFSAGRPSFAKRKMLAAKLFPDLPEGKLTKIVGSADKITWLKKSLSE
jgi:hypothetical protein